MDKLSIGIITMAGIAILGGSIGALLFKRIKIPQVVGYIIAGLFIGQSGFKLVTPADITGLEPFNMLALGVIGFLVGSEIHLEAFKKYGKQFSAILLLEGVLAFLFTALATGLILFKVTDSVNIAIAGGVVFGSIASATDPAATMSVLWEYKTAGVFATTLVAIIALDDALAMALYGIGSGVAQIVVGEGGGGAIFQELLKIGGELGGSLLIGLLTGEILTRIFRHTKQYESAVISASGLLLLMVGIGITFQFDIIIMAMTVGILFNNKNPHRSKRFIEYVQSLATPIYVFFFVLIGARISIGAMPGWLWGIIITYVLIRSLGKFFGAYMGAKLSKAPEVVVKNIGLGLFAQGGVAIGLSIMAAHHLDTLKVTEDMSLGDIVISAVATTTLFVQLIGPACVKLAAFRSGEAGRDISVEDFARDAPLREYLQPVPTVKESDNAVRVIEIFSSCESETLPVVNEEQKLLGIIGMPELRAILGDSSVHSFILASDIMRLEYVVADAGASLERALTISEQTQVEEYPVLDGVQYVGSFNRPYAQRRVSKELLQLKGRADG